MSFLFEIKMAKLVGSNVEIQFSTQCEVFDDQVSLSNCIF
jgi:hypothetical protein